MIRIRSLVLEARQPASQPASQSFDGLPNGDTGRITWNVEASKWHPLEVFISHEEAIYIYIYTLWYTQEECAASNKFPLNLPLKFRKFTELCSS